MAQVSHILLVEDNEDDGALLTQVVQLILGQQATVAKNGAEAIRLAHNESFDLVLLDLRLPGLSGLDVAEILRKMADYEDVPIIAMTAYDKMGIRRQSLLAGCDRYLVKPLDVSTIIESISEYLPTTQ